MLYLPCFRRSVVHSVKQMQFYLLAEAANISDPLILDAFSVCEVSRLLLTCCLLALSAVGCLFAGETWMAERNGVAVSSGARRWRPRPLVLLFVGYQKMDGSI
ncbi:hypothetical protein BRADI_2g09013v3 [Brachypodium distachyon]|uniref:Uncharacterized protein n=1 Tax=Brachypodium distachyon TaxID=15368 RepID=A0A2K2D7L1_BRADI|nr:hypothetical protein BRADI_2g09013v3 [Brachypodium distachyon]PNT70274.1 hypothetical protein BRADI_2g09013v3 [Brachypodium distachyon]